MDKEQAVLAPVQENTSYVWRGSRNSLIVLALLFVSIYIGSERFAYMDYALSGYLAASVVCFVAMTMRITAWTRRPPTRRLWKQLFRMLGSSAGWKFLFSTAAKNIGAQTFISKRSPWRWGQHMLISWGVILSFAITFALVFNWMHFELVDTGTYSVVVFGIPLFRMGVDSTLAIILYHGLNWTGILVIIGCLMAMYRRVKEHKVLVEQNIAFDIFPLLLLIAVSVSGSLLTVSAVWMEGFFYLGISLLHMLTVVVLLLYLPFGKFWHIPLRFLALVVPMYHALHEQKPCVRCGREYATHTQIQDVKDALSRRAIPLAIPGTGLHYADMCSECRRTANRLAAYGAKVGFEKVNVFAVNNGRNGLTKAEDERGGSSPAPFVSITGGDSHHARPER